TPRLLLVRLLRALTNLLPVDAVSHVPEAAPRVLHDSSVASHCVCPPFVLVVIGAIVSPPFAPAACAAPPRSAREARYHVPPHRPGRPSAIQAAAPPT